jgi:CheY-like chemotaxis protein
MTDRTEAAPAPQWMTTEVTHIAGQRILVVDDNIDAAESLGALLRCLGADVSTAYNGVAALESMTAYRPAVVVFDIGMPGMDGYELARRTRATPEGAEILLIALTGWGDDEERRKAAGIDHHLVKPVELGVIESLLASRRTAPAAGRAL